MNTDANERDVEILIVEDSPTQAEQLKYMLEQHGYRLATARNGRQALDAIRLHAPTLVISDVVMPEMDGYELCRRIKREETLKRTPVMLLTSLSDPADVVRGLECGADSFIFKPYEEHYLLARIAYTLANRHLRDNDVTQMGVEVFFGGRKFFITSDRLQILNLLLSTYEAAVHRNHELTAARDELRELNEHLETKVRERTSALQVEISKGKQVEQKLQSQLNRLNLLGRIARAIGERQDLRSIFDVVIRSLEDDLQIDLGCVCLCDPAADVLTVSAVGARNAALATQLALVEQTRIPVDANGLARCVRGHLVYEPDIARLPFAFSQRLLSGGLRSLVIAPLLAESKVFGVLIAARMQAEGFSSGDCEFLQQLSEHVALAAHHAQLYGALQQAYEDIRHSQQAVMQQERLRALGQMASGVAHDINNAISPVALYTESLLEQEPGLSVRARNYLTTIQRAVEDVAHTVRGMREFYRQREPEIDLTPVNLNKLIEQVIDLTRVRWRDVPQENGVVIDLCTDFSARLPSIMGSESEIRDALINLVFNAVDAMPNGGTLTIRTQSSRGDGADTVRLEVHDTGTGMDDETKRRCLEPFYTTKGERGTGLGLAMVYGMAQRHSADIQIDSVLGAGTTMSLVFPAVTGAAEATGRHQQLIIPAQPLRILIVDDDPLVIEALRNTLEYDGHLVTAAAGGKAGIDAFLAAHRRGEQFAVVFTDLGMPHVDGRKVAASVKAASPTTPVVLLTGWGQRLVADNDMPAEVDRILAKPPKLHELRRTLVELVT